MLVRGKVGMEGVGVLYTSCSSLLPCLYQFMPVVVIAPKSDPNYMKLQSNIEEVLARGGAVIAITDENNHDLDKCDYVIRVSYERRDLRFGACALLLSAHARGLRRCPKQRTS